MDFNFLEPKTTRFESAPDGTLRVQVEGDRCGLRVEVLRAFPLKHPEQYIVLRDGASKEIGVLRDLNDWPADVSTLLREQLRRRYFLPQITAINAVTDRFGSSVWDVETDRGPRSLTTRQFNEAMFEVEPNRYLLTDIEGNRYEIKNLQELDEASRARFLGK
jgi:hypothetical protein